MPRSFFGDYMAITPKNPFIKYNFVDRKVCLDNFKKAVDNIKLNKFNVLVYYGIAGIGKTSLRKEFIKYLQEYNEGNKNQDVTLPLILQQEIIWASLDLQLNKHREKSTFLVALKNDLQEEFKIDFPAFEIAHAIYWKKANPEISLRRDNYLFFEGNNVSDDIFGIVSQIPYFSIVPYVGRSLLKNLPDHLRKWWTKRGQEELKQLSEKEPLEIEEMLPYFWAQDLNNYLENTSKPAVLFIDTYEVLRENYSDDSYSLDKWIRKELISRFSQNVLWVICSKEALRWNEIDSEWDKYLIQYEVKKLFEKYCIEYLESREITNREIQEAIFEGSKGVPYYLELSADTYDKIVKIGEKPRPDNFGNSHQEIADRFFRYLNSEEKNLLNVLSISHFWDYNLFKCLVQEFNIGYPTTNYEDLCYFSFVVETENGRFQMHQLMRESLQKTQENKNPDSVKRTHEAIVKYYSNRLNRIDIKAITPEHEIALAEAFYHAKNVFGIGDLFNWFTNVLDPFYRAAFWQLITPMYEEMLQLLKTELGSDHIYVAIALNNLAELHRQNGEYKKALPLYKQACKIFEEKGEDKKTYSTTLNNLGLYYKEIGEYDKALLSYNKSLYISKIELGPQHPDVATTLSNLAGLYESIGDYDNAISHYMQALNIFKNHIGTEDQKYASTLNAFAELCRQIGDYKTSLTYHMEALKIRETVFGQEHPETGNSLYNLALLLLDMGEYDKALNNFDHVLRILNNWYSSEYPTIVDIHIASIFSNKAVLYSRMGNYDKALILYQQALTIRKDTLGPEHLDVVNTLNNLADLYYKIRNYDKAICLFEEALDILDIIERKLGIYHPHFTGVMNNLIVTYGKF